jgi:hypothetical protein
MVKPVITRRISANAINYIVCSFLEVLVESDHSLQHSYKCNVFSVVLKTLSLSGNPIQKDYTF